MRKSALILAAAATLAIAPSAALASPVNSTEFDTNVQHDDLDLTTERGIAVLDNRVRTRIRQMCRNGGRDSVSIRLERQCRSSARAAAESGVRLAIAEARANRRVRFAENTSSAPNADTPGA